MAEDDSLADLLRFVLIIGGITLFILSLAVLESLFTTILKYTMGIIGGIYVVYNGLTKEKQVEQTFYFIGMVLTIILILSFNFLFELGECTTLTDTCGENQFCASDHICHDSPKYTHEITKITINKETSFTAGGIIIDLGIIISALILRGTSFYPKTSKFFQRSFKALKALFRG